MILVVDITPSGLNHNHQVFRSIVIEIDRYGQHLVHIFFPHTNGALVNHGSSTGNRIPSPTRRGVEGRIVLIFHINPHPPLTPCTRLHGYRTDMITYTREVRTPPHLTRQIDGGITVVLPLTRNGVRIIGTCLARLCATRKPQLAGFHTVRAVKVIIGFRRNAERRQFRGIIGGNRQILKAEVVETVCFDGHQSRGEGGAFGIVGRTVDSGGPHLGGLLPEVIKKAALYGQMACHLYRLVDIIRPPFHADDGVGTGGQFNGMPDSGGGCGSKSLRKGVTIHSHIKDIAVG